MEKSFFLLLASKVTKRKRMKDICEAPAWHAATCPSFGHASLPRPPLMPRIGKATRESRSVAWSGVARAKASNSHASVRLPLKLSELSIAFREDLVKGSRMLCSQVSLLCSRASRNLGSLSQVCLALRRQCFIGILTSLCAKITKKTPERAW